MTCMGISQNGALIFQIHTMTKQSQLRVAIGAVPLRHVVQIIPNELILTLVSM